MEKASFTNPPFELRPFPFDFMREEGENDDFFLWHIDVVTATDHPKCSTTKRSMLVILANFA